MRSGTISADRRPDCPPGPATLAVGDDEGLALGFKKKRSVNGGATLAPRTAPTTRQSEHSRIVHTEPGSLERGSPQKRHGVYYTPDAVAASLVKWAIRNETDRLLDPACGDGRFLAYHEKSIGIEQDFQAASLAKERAPKADVLSREFFSWAQGTDERFDCVVGNPPFIRYQTFRGETRKTALELCATVGVAFSALTSSWAPFLVVASSLLRKGGRIAFVVPAEVGHAPYAAPALKYLINHFARVQVIAIREKIFAGLSEDCWLLYAEGFGGRTDEIRLSSLDSFQPTLRPPSHFIRVSVTDWGTSWNQRLRPFLVPSAVREIYSEIAQSPDTKRLGDVAKVGIGYVSGDNEFFHLRPSHAAKIGIPRAFLHPTVRNGRALPKHRLTTEIVGAWYRADDPILLLRIPKNIREVPSSIQWYLGSEKGHRVREGYKCRNRDPWYSVPDVRVPDFFLTYMSGRNPSLVQNLAGCTCTNALHAVRLTDHAHQALLVDAWKSPLTRLSCEIEGHPLGGGMLKLEPGEASSIILPSTKARASFPEAIVEEGIAVMQSWRHY
ncbi:MAG TPA: N-6 DNA methylase [Stellaceae bacterium]|nr:N-6 DNA methylase [Stellaceae bacterium]